MSGILGVINWNGAPVDRRLVARMTEALRPCGPDAQDVWLDGSVVLAHASLHTRDEAPERQPRSADARLWITADARIDARACLVAELGPRADHDLDSESDAALILRAYRVWGERCVEHLLGDFAFAIWDAERRRIFCARDHFGVKPLFYAQVADTLVFSSTLDCVRLHPGISSDLDDRAIGDFLLYGVNRDPSTTAFTAIRRLPPAHRLYGAGRLHPARYWTLPIGAAIQYRRAHDYVDRFSELLGSAVADRLRCRRVGVLMSGGLDSTSIAATTKRCLSEQGAGFDLRAYTTIVERVAPDAERFHAPVAAAALGMPIHYRIVDEYEAFERWSQPGLRWPEPESDPLAAIQIDQLQDAAAHGRVLLTGCGADPAFRVPIRYATELLRRGRVGRVAADVAWYVLACHRLPRVRIASHLHRWLRGGDTARDALPPWLDADFVARLNLRERSTSVDREPAVHPTRPDAYRLLTSSEWPGVFESFDPGVTGVPIETRHPFFDLRLIDYLLAIPPMPWCFDKTVLRLAMRGLLPESIRLRPKTVAQGDPLVALLERPAAQWVDHFAPAPALHAYVDRKRIPPVCGEANSASIWTNLRPLCLDHWLRSQAAVPHAHGRTA